MLSGLKFVPRDQIDKENDETSGSSKKERRKPGHGKEKDRRKNKKSYNSSSDEGALVKIKSGSRKKKKWYDSDEDMSSYSEGSGSQSESESKQKKSLQRENKRRDGSEHESKSRSKKKARSRRKEYSSEDESSSGSEREKPGRTHKGRKSRGKEDDEVTDASGGTSSQKDYNNVVRKEMGLDWMLRPKDNIENISTKTSYPEPDEVPTEEVEKDYSREQNPYLKDNGSGYPDESDGVKSGSKQILSSVVVGDGGASWRLKALKRAKEQATREGRNLQEVVEERWGSVGQFAASVASRNVAPTHAHLQAINHRRRGLIKEEQTNRDEETDKIEEESRRDRTPRHRGMRLPKVQDSLSWGKRGKKDLSTEDAALVSAAMSNLNKFSDDGSFIDKFKPQKNDNSGDPSNSYDKLEGKMKSRETKEDAAAPMPAMTANQFAAKALQLRMKGKHEEAEELLKEAEKIKVRQHVGDDPNRAPIDGTTSRYIMHDVSMRQKNKGEDADLHLAQKIMHSHRSGISDRADEEYDYDDGPRRKTRKKGGDGNYKSSEINNSAKRILTQQERCQFCFESPTRPKHLVIAIANFTYLSLPQRQPVVPGHCGILTLQHELSTRTVDDNVWEEIRNFKKCLIMMFAKQEKDVVFLETVMGLAQQKRHCMVECLPLPREIAKQAPVYFKKAIDEAEDEWSQHNAKKLIDTSEKGLRSSIPKNFPYFHVEFGLNRGFVHVIDNERDFKSSFGINVIRGMMQLPAEDMHRRQRHESVESQQQAVASFAQEWAPFDWTKQLG